MLCYAMLCYAMLCYAMLCYVLLCYAIICYAMLSDAMLCYTFILCIRIIKIIIQSLNCEVFTPAKILCEVSVWRGGGRLSRPADSWTLSQTATIPANMRRWPNVDLLLAHPLRRLKKTGDISPPAAYPGGRHNNTDKKACCGPYWETYVEESAIYIYESWLSTRYSGAIYFPFDHLNEDEEGSGAHYK